MNIYKVLIFTSFFLQIFSYKNINHKKTYLALYLKKSRVTKSLLYSPKTENQEKYVEYLNNYNTKIVLSIGPAGCGKTLFACQKAINDLLTNNINKIIITRPVVCVDEEIGFLPGNIIKKMDPWTRPIFDIFLEHYSRSELDLMLNNGVIEICPLAFMRGRTFKNCFIIADEMQNSSPNQMKMLTTRLGDNSRMVITGDLQQSDILKDNGLNDFVNKFKSWNEISELIQYVQFNNTDIERSEIVKAIIDIYDDKTKSNIISNLNNDSALMPNKHLSNNYYDVFTNDKYFTL